ncbi:MAG: hypothetical protein KKB20_02325, partial [Proteobacteria bacterium]|nr:hypothetical protein [Pseudomonadota bacterium]
MKWLLLSIRPGSGRMITPPRALTASFLLLIVIGTAVLLIPGMSGPKGLSAVDALFTATSAVCVTGLVVVDTGLDFTLGGQLAIMVLIQLGGLGIMTFSVLFYRLVGREISLRDELAVRDSFSFSKSQDLGSLVRSVVLMTLAIEGLGALLLFTFLLGDYAPVRAAYLAVFHAVSAFCNAGFSHGLGGDSLTRYAGHWPINLVIMGLIVSGGIGFIALSEIFVHKTRLRRLSLHTKLVCLTSLVLILFGTAMFLLLEWDNVMAGR